MTFVPTKVYLPEFEEESAKRREERKKETIEKRKKKKKKITARTHISKRIIMGLIIQNGYFLRSLDKLEIYILTEYYGKLRGMERIGEDIGVSRQRVQQVEQKAMWKFYQYLQDKKII